MISIKELSVDYISQGSQYAVLRHINLELAAGETCAIIGPSGCGKSTLLKVIAGIVRDFEGEALLNGQPVSPDRQKIGFIPQNYGLLPWRNVAENICLGVKIKQRQDKNKKITVQQKQQVQKEQSFNLAELLRQLGLTGLESRYPGELSGGQQQRVALARSFFLQPDVLLMDEPFSALDALTREEIQNIFLATWRQHAVSTVLVTHQVEEAVYLGQKIIVLSPAPGTVCKVIVNPLFGGENIRNRSEFFQLTLALRTVMKEDWSK